MKYTSVVVWCSLSLATVTNGQIQFEDVSDKAGIGELGQFSISWLDYNNDGLLDLIVGGRRNGHVQVLFQSTRGQFINATSKTYEQGPYGYSQGVGDYDNDGRLDFLVTSPFDTFTLFNNNGDGTFADVTTVARVAVPDKGPSVRTGTSFADIDGDGLLDLFVGNEAGSDFVYRNEGNGTFADVTESANLAIAGGTRFHMFADIDNDGDADLFVAHSIGNDVPDSLRDVPSTLYRNEGDGTFTDITQTAGIDHSLRVMQGVSFFDFDNDSWLDLFIASGLPGGGTNLLYHNKGDGTFVEIGDQVGIRESSAVANYSDVVVGDYDNDGWLDLFVASFDAEDKLFRNNGDGTFSDETIRSGIATENVTFQVGTGDYDGDGFMDILLSNMDSPETLLRNAGNTNHWLQLELIGVDSNRSSIGARIHVVAGDLSMWREVNGGNGYGVDGLKAAFGLGRAAEAKLVEISWPSGKTTRLDNVAADQHIRVFEGREGYLPVEWTIWDEVLADTMIAGTDYAVRAVLRPPLFTPGARITQVVADLSDFGEPAKVPLDDLGDGTYRLQTVWAGANRNGLRIAKVLIEQATYLGAHQIALLHPVIDLPEGDLSVLADELAAGWEQTLLGTAKMTPLEDASTYQADGIWFVDFVPPQPIVQTGYQSLSFVIKPEAVAAAQMDVFLNNISVPLWSSGAATNLLDLEKDEWQEVSIPLMDFNVQGSIERLRFRGTFTGQFQLDDVRLVVVEAPPVPTVPTVVATPASPVPNAPWLGQNYPNPFNSTTTIPYTISRDEEVELLVYSIVGQEVATLIDGRLERGVHTAYWDGRDRDGQSIASGLYLYRLRVGTYTETRKLLLLR